MVVPNCLAYKCQLNTYCMHSPTPHPTPMLYCNNWAYPHFLWTIVIILPDPSLSAIMQFMNSPYQIWQEGVERQFFIWCLIVEQVVAAAVRATGARLSVRRLVVEPSDHQGSSPPGSTMAPPSESPRLASLGENGSSPNLFVASLCFVPKLRWTREKILNRPLYRAQVHTSKYCHI